MFESAEIGHQVDKRTYDKALPAMREALLEAQYELVRTQNCQVIIIVSGIDGGGRRESVHRLNEWLDPRHVETHGMGAPSDEEQDRPPMWRFWRALPPRGKIGIFQGSWYSLPILDRVFGRARKIELEEAMTRNVQFEKMLSDEGALIIKFWFHLSKPFQESRLKALEKDPRTRWRVTERDWEHFKRYDKFRKASGLAIQLSSTAQAPWYIVEGSDPHYRELMLGKILLEALSMRLKAKHSPSHSISALPNLPKLDQQDILRSLKLDQAMEKAEYEKKLEHWQGRLNVLTRHPNFEKISVVSVFEGNDAAGKGGAIRRITAALDARSYSVIPIAAPTDEEKSRPYLWRFWRHMPRRGRFAIFDRSWYGRVLVERVEGFCTEYDWLRAYNEINDFESQLTSHNMVVLKFWLSISKDEQLARFKAREKTSFKQFKITADDWRNRERWDEYEEAVCDMLDRTSTEKVPWTLVPANNKYAARIQVLQTLCETLESALKHYKRPAKQFS